MTEAITNGTGAEAGAGDAGNSRVVALDRGGAAVANAVPAAVGPRVARIPGSIVKAICQIKSTVEAIKKSQRNTHGGYMFSSTDDFYAAISRKMGEVGLVCMALEEKCEIKRLEMQTKDGPKTTQWANIEYSFVWATETDTWSDPRAKRSIYVQVTGPQTFQAAQSFIEKAYYRSTFKIPSGDMDLDSMPQAEFEEDQNDLLAPRKRKSSSAAKKDGTTDVFNDLRGAISNADGPADLHLLKKNNWSVWQAMPTRWMQILDAEFEDKLAEFEVEATGE